MKMQLIALLLTTSTALAATTTFESPADLAAYSTTVTSNATLSHGATVGAGSPPTGGVRFVGNTSATDRGSISYKAVPVTPGIIGTWQTSILVNMALVNDDGTDKGELRLGFSTGTSVAASKPWEYFHKNNPGIHVKFTAEEKLTESKDDNLSLEISSSAVAGTEIKYATAALNQAPTFDHWHRLTLTIERISADTYHVTYLLESLGPTGTSTPVTILQTSAPAVITNTTFANAATVYHGFALKTEKSKTTPIDLDDLTLTATPSAPSAPTALSATSVNTGGFTANWQPGTGLPAQNWVLEVTTQANHFAPGTFISATGTSGQSTGISITPTSTLSQTLTGLTALETYVYRIKGVNAVGESGYSNVITTTLPDTNAPPFVNALPNLGPIPTWSAPITVNLTGITAGGEPGQTVTITATSSDTSVVPHPFVSYTAPASAGTLTIDPTGTEGTATITVTLNDGQAENNLFTRTFTITVSNPPVSVGFQNAADLTTFFTSHTANASVAHLPDGGAASTGGIDIRISTTGLDSGFLSLRNQTYPFANATAIHSSLKINAREINDTVGQERKAEFRLGFSPTNIVSASKPDEFFHKTNHGISIKLKAENKPGTLNNLECELENFNGLENKAGKITLPNATEIDEWLELRLTLIPIGGNSFLTSYSLHALGVNGDEMPETLIQSPAFTLTNATFAAASALYAGYAVKVDKKNTSTEGVFVDDHRVEISTDPADTPVALDATRITSSTFNANWQPGPGAYASGYIVEVVAGMNDFLPGNLVATHTLTGNANRTFRITGLTPATAYRYRVIGTNLNGQSAPSNIISLTTLAAGINSPPTLDAIPDPAPLAVNTGVQTLPLTGISDGGELTQTVTITAHSSNTDLIPHPSVTYTSPAATGTLSFTPNANAVGNALITVTASDGAGNNNSFTRSFTIIVVSPPALIDFNDPADLTTKLSRTLEGAAVTADASAGVGSPATGGVALTGTTAGLERTFLGIRPTAYDASSAGYLTTSLMVNFAQVASAAVKDHGELRIGFISSNAPNLSKLNDTMHKTPGIASLGLKFKIEHEVGKPDKDRMIEAELFAGPNDTKAGKFALLQQNVNRWFRVSLYAVRTGLSSYAMTYFVQDYGPNGDTPGTMVMADGPYTFTSAAFATDTSVFSAFIVKGAKEGNPTTPLHFDNHETIVNTTAPFAPTTEEPFNVDFDTATLSWTPSPQGRTPTSYYIELVPAAANFEPGQFLSATGLPGQATGFLVSSPPSQEFTVQGLQPLTSYKYRIMAAIESDFSAAINSRIFTTPDTPIHIGPAEIYTNAGPLNRAVFVQGDFDADATLIPNNPLITSGIVALNITESLSLGQFSRVIFTLGQTRHTKLIANVVLPVHSTARFQVNLGSFIPQPGAQFDLFDWGSLTPGGDLDWSDNLDLPALPVGLDWDVTSFSTTGIIRITGTPTPLAFTEEPVADQVLPNSTATFTAAVTGTAPWLFQWLKNATPIPNAVSSTLTLTAVTEGDDAFYSVRVTNGIDTITSTPVRLQVYDPPHIVTPPQPLVTNPGHPVTFTVAATTEIGTMSYLWRFNGAPIDGAPSLPSYTITNPTEAREGSYSVSVTNPAGTTTSTAATLTVNDPIQITSHPQSRTIPNGGTATFTVAAVGSGTLSYQWQFDGTDLPGENSDTLTFTVTPEKTGRYRVKVSNVVGHTFSQSATLTLGGWYVGSYEAPIPRNASLNANLGGILRVTTTADLTYTGRLTLGATTYPLKDKLTLHPADPMRPSATYNIPRKAPAAPLTLTLHFGPDAIENIILTDGTDTVTTTGWRNPWNKNVLPTAYAGYYTLGLDTPASPQESRPEGTGYASFTVSPTNGSLTVSGRLADGTAFSSAGFAGPHGEVAVFRTLYAARTPGSLVGALQIAKASVNADNTLTGELSWWKQPAPGRNYTAGFGPLDLSAVGARYSSPAPNTLVLGISPSSTTNNAHLEFTDAGMDGKLPAADERILLRLDSKQKVFADTATKPKSFTATLNPKTGLITGSFVLTENHPFLTKPTPINRTVTWHALIVRDATGQRGIGHFLLPQLPSSSTEKPTTTPILSGQVLFDKLP